jgi:hypothetical protein
LKHGSEEVKLEFPQNRIFELKVEEEEGKRLKRSSEIELVWIIGEEQKKAHQFYEAK